MARRDVSLPTQGSAFREIQVHTAGRVFVFQDEGEASAALHGYWGNQARRVTVRLAGCTAPLVLVGRGVARARRQGIRRALTDVLLARSVDVDALTPVRASAVRGLAALGVDPHPTGGRHRGDGRHGSSWVGMALRWVVDSWSGAVARLWPP